MLMIEWDGVFASINEDKIEWVYVDESIYSPPVPEVRFPFIVNTPCFVPECAASDSVAPTFFVHLDFPGMDETSRKDGKDRLAFHAEISVIDDEKSESMGKRARESSWLRTWMTLLDTCPSRHPSLRQAPCEMKVQKTNGMKR